MAAAFAGRFPDQRRGVGVAQLQHDMFVAQGGEGFEQVIDVEADGQALDPGIGLDLFLGFFLFGVVRADAQQVG